MLSKLKFNYRVRFIIFISGVFLLICLSSLYYLKQLQDEFIQISIESQSEVLTNLAAQDIAKLIYLNDPDTAANIIQQLKSLSDIHNVIFYDNDNKPVLSYQAPHKLNENIQIFTINKTLSYDGLVIGYAKYQLHNFELNLEQKKSNSIFGIFLVSLLILSTLLILLIDYRFIGRLSKLSIALKKVAESKDFSFRLAIDRKDDIGQANHHFNQLVEIVEHQTINLEYQANHDNLTGLYNRYKISKVVDKLIAKRPSTQFHAISFINVNQLKIINDACGHSAGDDLIIALSQHYLATIKTYECVTIGHVGGTNFVMLFENLSKKLISSILNNILETTQHFTYTVLEREFHVGVNIGCILFAHENTSTSELLSTADTLCFKVKQDNQNHLEVTHLDDNRLLDHKNSMDWVSRIYDALSFEKFCIYLQPIVSTQSKSSHWNHFEALIRLHENSKVISPFHFVPIAERYGLTQKLDSWVVDAVFKHLKCSSDFLKSINVISINLSVHSLVDDKFTKNISELFLLHKIPYQNICFEITETGVISELNNALNFINHFNNLGVKFSLDDFGSGMSSFAYLKNLPVDYLKIDGHFVKGISTDPIMKEMVASMVKIGHISNKQVVAEHVEDEETLLLLKAMEVDFIQGYFYSKPEPIENFISNQVQAVI